MTFFITFKKMIKLQLVERESLMKIRDVAKKDYAQLIVHCKNVLNYNKFFNVYNENLHNRMAMY